MTASMSFWFPIVVGVTVSAVSTVSTEVHRTVHVASCTSVLVPLKISEDISCVPVVVFNQEDRIVPSHVNTYPSVGILSCPRKFCAR